MNVLRDYPIRVQIQVTWGEMDSFGHVNNIYYFRYFETTRVHFFHEIGLLQYMKETGIGPILAETSCTFKKPIFYPNTLTVGSGIRSVGKDSFYMDYCISSEQSGISATGEARIVMYDYNRARKTDIPHRLKSTLENYKRIDG
jgi:acyl-CoA thioester hydrolase